MSFSYDDPRWIEIRNRYLKVETATVSDILDEMGRPHQGLAADFTPTRPELERLGGWAYTVRGEMLPYPETGDPEKMRAIEGMQPGCISVWSGGGAEGICFFGEMLALGMKRRGCEGALVDGGLRDVKWVAKLDFPVFARYRTPVQSIGRWKVSAYQVPVYMPGTTTKWVEVRPGDFILADFDGAISVPADVVEEVLEKAERLTEQERLVRQSLESGMSMEEVLAKYGHV